MKRGKIICLLAAAMLCAAGCQAPPEEAVVAGKNNGALESALEAAPEETAAADEPAAEAAPYAASFTSADGNIAYTAELDMPVPGAAMPVIQVTPHTFTAGEAEQIARALFGDAEIYEYSMEKSKSEIEEEILSLKQHISDRAALVEYYGGEESIADAVTIDYESRISRLEEQYSEAPETVEPEPCRWEFHPQSYYDPSLSPAQEEGYDDTQSLKAMIRADGTPYVYWVSNRDAADYRIHNIYAYIDDLCVPEEEKISTERISQEDAEEILDTVNGILERLDMGDWVIDSYEISEGLRGSDTTYVMNVTVCPVYGGVKVTHLPQLESLKTDDAYASNYYYEEIRFQFSGGRLISFEWLGPLDVVSVVNDNVETLSAEEVISAFEGYMKLDDITGYQIQGIPEELAGEVPQVVEVRARVDRAEPGLVRTRIQNNAADFYLVPAYTFSGTVLPYYSDGGEDMESETVFAVISAVDGTVINTELGY